MYAGIHCLSCDALCGARHADSSSRLILVLKRPRYVCSDILDSVQAGKRCPCCVSDVQVMC